MSKTSARESRMNKVQIMKLFEKYQKEGFNKRDSLDKVIELLYSRSCYNMETSKIIKNIKNKYSIIFDC